MMFKIVGMGPGHSDYVLPIAKRALDEADVIIGGKRHIEPFQKTDKELIHVEGQLSKLPEMIRGRQGQNIVVAVSGDTGFYSLLSYMKKNFEEEEMDVIPGISSLQYMYGRIGRVYQNSFIGSVHGRDLNFSSMVNDYETVGLLTDQKNTPSEIAKKLLKEGMNNVSIYVGENLSYENETITKGLPSEIKDKTFSDLVVVILERK
ncbi:precorrin-6y C5,15-methyltransferase (decarboxylating) subunit CbiE [Fusibacter sp. JL216-2]|uniref:precorrin-6y C5,15-methyltransferase (decarboxylating) subunit CbiE n=1 Tax=Fusibacter sp. JL216-2 TaxID=3071453 RepID=UPI003D359060